MKRLILAIAALCLFSGLAMAAQKVGTFGTLNSSGTAPLEVDIDRTIYFASDAGIVYPYEVATTSDTLTATESGKTIIYRPASTRSTFTLPTAQDGLWFRFVAATGSSHVNKELVIDPASTDTLVGCVVSGATSTFAAGDSIISAGTTGDSLTLVGMNGYWYCTDRISTWVDNN